MSWLTDAKNEVVTALYGAGYRAFGYEVPAAQISPVMALVVLDNPPVSSGGSWDTATVNLKVLVTTKYSADQDVTMAAVEQTIETVFEALPVQWEIVKVEYGQYGLNTSIMAAQFFITNNNIEIGG